MLVTMSNPGLHLAVIGNPGRKKRRSRKGKSMARRRRMTSAQKKALAKGFRARGLPVPAKLRTNPGTKAGARKSRRKLRRKQLSKRRSAAKAYRKRARGYHVVVRRKTGRRKTNRRFGRSYGIKTGRKGTISFRRRKGGRSRLVATNPRRRRSRRSRRRTRTNPPLTAASWMKGITSMPQNVMGIFKGKDMVPNLGMAGLGAVSGIVVGGMTRGFVLGAVGKVAPNIASNRLVQGVLGGLITYSGGYVAGRMLIKNDRRRIAFVTGSATAALVQLLFPGAITGMLTRIPVVGPMMANLPGMSGLGAYVAAPGYQGVGRYPQPLAGYVEAPGYQAVGYDPAVAGNDDALAGELGAYVAAPGYQGVGDIGMWGSSHLDQ